MLWSRSSAITENVDEPGFAKTSLIPEFSSQPGDATVFSLSHLAGW
jgi:hypothetical protein